MELHSRTRKTQFRVHNPLLFLGKPIICGGYKHPLVFQDCFLVGQPCKSDHFQTKDMLFKRAAASSIVLSPDTLWIVGGYDPDYDHLNSTEFVRFDEKSILGGRHLFRNKRFMLDEMPY